MEKYKRKTLKENNRYGKYIDKYFSKFNEESLSRVFTHSKKGFIIISAFRGEKSEEENIKRTYELRRIVRRNNLGYFVIDGYWIENRGKEDEYHSEELSLFIPYRENISPNEFVEFAEYLREKYNQDAVLVKDPSKEFEHLMLIYKGGDVEILRGRFEPDRIAQAYSKIKKGSHKGRTFIFEGYQIPSNSMSVSFFKKEGIIILWKGIKRKY